MSGNIKPICLPGLAPSSTTERLMDLRNAVYFQEWLVMPIALLIDPC